MRRRDRCAMPTSGTAPASHRRCDNEVSSSASCRGPIAQRQWFSGRRTRPLCLAAGQTLAAPWVLGPSPRMTAVGMRDAAPLGRPTGEPARHRRGPGSARCRAPAGEARGGGGARDEPGRTLGAGCGSLTGAAGTRSLVRAFVQQADRRQMSAPFPACIPGRAQDARDPGPLRRRPGAQVIHGWHRTPRRPPSRPRWREPIQASGSHRGEAIARAAPYSITSSARVSTVNGIESPSAFAALRLMTISSVVGCSIGMSDGLAPLRILSTKLAVRK